MVSDGQHAAICYQKRLADEVEATHANRLIALYRGEHEQVDGNGNPQVLTHMDITRTLYPDLSPEKLEHYRRAVSIALPRLFEAKEYRALTERAYKARGRRTVERDPEAWSESARKAWGVRYAKHGAPVEALAKGRGVTLWSDIEITDLIELSLHDDYKIKSGPGKGWPYYSAIALELKLRHGNKRDGKRTRRLMRRLRSSQRERLEAVLTRTDKLDLLERIK